MDDGDDGDGHWVTIDGEHVFIKGDPAMHPAAKAASGTVSNAPLTMQQHLDEHLRLKASGETTESLKHRDAYRQMLSDKQKLGNPVAAVAQTPQPKKQYSQAAIRRIKAAQLGRKAREGGW